jgi:hypothetical protein
LDRFDERAVKDEHSFGFIHLQVQVSPNYDVNSHGFPLVLLPTFLSKSS